MATQGRIADVSEGVETHLSEIFSKCVYNSVTVDESTYITSTAQKCIFARGVISDFEVFEERIGPY
jgi:hypothetical protein